MTLLTLQGTVVRSTIPLACASRGCPQPMNAMWHGPHAQPLQRLAL